MYEPGRLGSKAPNAPASMKCAPTSGEKLPAWMNPAARASATVGYLNAASRPAISSTCSCACFAEDSGWNGIFCSANSSVLHEPSARPRTQLRAAVEGVGVAATSTDFTTVFVSAFDAPTAYA